MVRVMAPPRPKSRPPELPPAVVTRVTPMMFGEVAGLVIDVDGSEPQLQATLSAAEREIVALVLGGCNGHEIAARRGRSYRTIANQLARIYRKLGVDNRTDLIAALSGSRRT